MLHSLNHHHFPMLLLPLLLMPFFMLKLCYVMNFIYAHCIYVCYEMKRGISIIMFLPFSEPYSSSANSSSRNSNRERKKMKNSSSYLLFIIQFSFLSFVSFISFFCALLFFWISFSMKITFINPHPWDILVFWMKWCLKCY